MRNCVYVIVIVVVLFIGISEVIAQGRWVDNQSRLPTRDFVFGQLWFNSATSGWYTDLIHSRIWHTSDGGENWTAIQMNVEGTSGIFFTDESNGWIGVSIPGGGIYNTVNGGEDWELQAIGPYGDHYIGSFRDFYFLNDSIGWAVGGESWQIDEEHFIIKRAVMQTLNGGDDWSVKLFEEWGNELPQDSIPIREFKHIAFADSLNGIIAPTRGFYITEDGGESLSELQYPDFHVNDLVNIDNEKYLLVGGRVQHNINKAQILKSRDGGAGWDTVFSMNGEERSNLFDLAMVPGTEDGWATGYRDNDRSPFVLKTTNSGDDWEEVEFPDFDDLMVIFFFDSLHGWIITLDNEILNYEPDNEVEDRDNSLPIEYSFARAYPNPFNNHVQITYEVPVRTDVSISIFDLTGREVATPYSGSVTSGRHSLNWNAEGLPAGEYLLRLTTENGTTQSTKLVLVK